MTEYSSVPLELLQRAYERLPPRQQQLLRMARVERLSCAEIGERLGLSPPDVERLLAMALVSLDRQLERMKWQERRRW